MTIDLFITCLNDALFPRTGEATTRVLERLGHAVKFNPQQTCCGQMHFNTGYQQQAIPIIKNFIDTFKDAEVVVAPSGSCVAMVRDLYIRAAEWTGDEKLAEEVKKLAPRVFELSEFIVNQLGIEDVGAFYPHRVTYHPTCHSARLLKVGDAPLKLLRKVREMTLIELPQADQCCGFGGTFSIKNADTSTAMMADKVANIISTKAEACTAGDNSCLMHIGGGLTRLDAGKRTIHIAEILASTEQEKFA